MRVIGRVLLGVGVFLIVLAPFLRYYAYPRLAVAPADQTLRIVSTGPNANVLDPATFTNYKTNLTATRLVQGDVAAAQKAGSNTDVWVSTVSTLDSKGNVLQRTIERAAFDATTSQDVHCCGEYVSVTKGVYRPVTHTGIVFKFPFDTQQQTYPFWDLTLRKAFPMVYQDTETLDGVRVYKFVQTIQPTPSAPPQRLNANAMDLPGPITATVETRNYYSNVRTVWVEPYTGVIIKGQEKQYNTIRAEGADRVVTTAVTIGYDAASVRMLADTFGPKGARLHVVRDILPLICLVVGSTIALIATLVTILQVRSPRGRRRRGASTERSAREKGTNRATI